MLLNVLQCTGRLHGRERSGPQINSQPWSIVLRLRNPDLLVFLPHILHKLWDSGNPKGYHPAREVPDSSSPKGRVVTVLTVPAWPSFAERPAAE